MEDKTLVHDAAYVTTQLQDMSAAQELMGEEWAVQATENILSQYDRHLRRRTLDVRGTMSEVHSRHVLPDHPLVCARF